MCEGEGWGGGERKGVGVFRSGRGKMGFDEEKRNEKSEMMREC